MKTGGRAFPRPVGAYYEGKDIAALEVTDDQQGMTLRDYFAGQALAVVAPSDSDMYVAQADAAKKHGLSYEEAQAVKAYALADAMLAERDKEQG